MLYYFNKVQQQIKDKNLQNKAFLTCGHYFQNNVVSNIVTETSHNGSHLLNLKTFSILTYLITFYFYFC
jgi:hypothetical protein